MAMEVNVKEEGGGGGGGDDQGSIWSKLWGHVKSRAISIAKLLALGALVLWLFLELFFSGTTAVLTSIVRENITDGMNEDFRMALEMPDEDENRVERLRQVLETIIDNDFIMNNSLFTSVIKGTAWRPDEFGKGYFTDGEDVTVKYVEFSDQRGEHGFTRRVAIMRYEQGVDKLVTLEAGWDSPDQFYYLKAIETHSADFRTNIIKYIWKHTLGDVFLGHPRYVYKLTYRKLENGKEEKIRTDYRKEKIRHDWFGFLAWKREPKDTSIAVNVPK